MKLILICTLTVISTFSASNCWCYDLATHGYITLETHRRSYLGAADGGLLRDLGIARIPGPFGLNPNQAPYRDFRVDNIGVQRYCNGALENEVFRILIRDAGLQELSLPWWLICGTVREDDIPGNGGLEDDPWLFSYYRVFNHFFDPLNNRALGDGMLLATIICVRNRECAKRSPDWAWGVDDAFAAQPRPTSNRSNHFSILDAREAMYRALTGRGPGGPYDETQRKSFWATTFRALGSVLHHVQDMAQPQHTRNEPHSGFGSAEVQARISGHASSMEHYIECRMGRIDGEIDSRVPVDVITGQPLPCNALDFRAWPEYAIPQFNRYSNYWSTSVGAGSLTIGKGLADYSHRGFFTEAKNVDRERDDYPRPTAVPGAYTIEELVEGSARITFLRGDVPDTVRGGSDNIRMTGRGMWYRGSAILMDGTHVLNRYVLDDQVSLLLPRAAAYGAGLLDYFFRGRMEITLPDEGVYAVVDHNTPQGSTKDSGGFNKIKLKLQNMTPAIQESGGGPTYEQHMSAGSLLAVVKFRRNQNYVADFTANDGVQNWGPAFRDQPEEIAVSDPTPLTQPLEAGADPTDFTFNFPTRIPINALDLQLQVVFRGQLGSEADAVVATTKNVGEPSFWSLYNNTDSLFCVAGQWYFKTPNGVGQDGTIPQSLIDSLSLTPAEVQRLRQQSFATTLVGFGEINADEVLMPLADVYALPPQKVARLALITDPIVPYNWTIPASYVGPRLSFRSMLNDATYLSNLIRTRKVARWEGAFAYYYVRSPCDDETPPPPFPPNTIVPTPFNFRTIYF